MKKSNPLKLHFTLFLILSVVALAQLSWWVIFQVQEGSRLTAQQEAVWDQQIKIAQTYFGVVNPQDSEKISWLQVNFPDLLLDPETGFLTASPEAENRLNKLAQKRVRMFVSEGAFFSLLVLTGIWFLFWALRKRIELENKTAVILNAAAHGLKNPIAGIKSEIETLLGSSNMDPSQKELIGKMSSDVQKIADTCESVSLIQMLTASRRKIELEMIDVSRTTESIIDGYLTAHSKEISRIKSEIAGGLTAVTNTRQWSRIVQGILQIMDNATPLRDTIDIIFMKNRDSGILKVSCKPDSADKDIDIIYRDAEAESGIIGELGETIGVKIMVFVESGNTLCITAELPLLEE